MIVPNQLTVHMLLSERARYVVPHFQRGFVWAREEAEEYFNDLTSEPDANLFLGTMIFQTRGDRPGEVTIIDGQQRITSILLLLIAIREAFKALGDRESATLTQDSIAPLDKATRKKTGTRLVASRSIKDVFDWIAEPTWDGTWPDKINGAPVKRQVSKVRPVYDAFASAISAFKSRDFDQLLNAIYETRFIRITVDADEEVFSLFERTNARGLDLEVSDLLKNYLHQEVGEEVESKWVDIIENAGGTVLRMLKYFYVSQKGSVQQKKLYMKLKSFAKELSGAASLVEQIDKFSQFYVVARREEDWNGTKRYFESLPCPAISEHKDKLKEIHSSLVAIRFFRVAQVLPLIYAGVNSFTRTQGADHKPRPDTLVRLVKAIENFHFVNTVICEKMGNEVEKPYGAFCTDFQSTSDFQRTLEEVIQFLRKKRAGEDEFVSKFSAICYDPSPPTLGLIQYVFDRISNFGTDVAIRLPIFDTDPTVKKKEFNVEHIYPKSPPKSVSPDSATMEVIDNIGNLLPMTYRNNSRLDNDLPARKFERLRGSDKAIVHNSAYISSFVEQYGRYAENWDKEVILRRAQDLAQHAFNTVWLIR